MQWHYRYGMRDEQLKSNYFWNIFQKILKFAVILSNLNANVLVNILMTMAIITNDRNDTLLQDTKKSHFHSSVVRIIHVLCQNMVRRHSRVMWQSDSTFQVGVRCSVCFTEWCVHNVQHQSTLHPLNVPFNDCNLNHTLTWLWDEHFHQFAPQNYVRQAELASLASIASMKPCDYQPCRSRHRPLREQLHPQDTATQSFHINPNAISAVKGII